MEKVFVFGYGNNFKQTEPMLLKQYDVLGVIDNNVEKQGEISLGGVRVLSPEVMHKTKFDFVIITPDDYMSILLQLKNMYVDNDKIRLLQKEENHYWQDYNVIPLFNGGIRYCFDKIKADIFTRSDKMVLTDIFMHNSWDFFVGDDSKCVVIDIGMNIGLATLFFAGMDSVSVVYGFEPFPATYKRAINNFRINCDWIQEKIISANIGLGKKSQKINMLYDPDYTTNMRTNNGRRLHGEREYIEEIKIEAVDTIMKDILYRHSDKKIVMKVDCEGAEYDIFDCLNENKLLRKIDMILLETHDGKEEKIRKILKDNKFMYFDNYQGGFYKSCIIPAEIGAFNKFFDKDIEICEEDYVDIYKAESAEDILAKMARPMPFCRYCNRKNIKQFGSIPWEKSHFSIKEWTE